MRKLKVTDAEVVIEIIEMSSLPVYVSNPVMTVNKTPSTSTIVPGKRDTEVKSKWL